MKDKIVSIIMPTYNREKTILRAVESVINQTYPFWELYIVDDAGNDGTEKLILENYKMDNRIHYVKNIKNGGPAFARNRGITLAKGEYYAFLDSDDEWINIHLEEAINLLEKSRYKIASALWYEEKDGSTTSILQYDWYRQSSDQASKELSINMKEECIFFGDNFLEYIINSGYYCFHINTIVIHKSVIEAIGLFDEKLKASEDMDFLYRIFEHYNLLLINKPHFIYHYGIDNIYAFIERDIVYENMHRLDEVVKDKIIYTLYYKIIFFRKLRIRSKKNSILFNKVKKSIDFNILRRYLTICYLSEKIKYKIYLFQAIRYIHGMNDIKTILGYKKNRHVLQYFCDD